MFLIFKRSHSQEFVYEAAGPTMREQGGPVSFQKRSLFSDNEPETVEAQRRRRGSGSGPSGRADMPSRPSSSGGGGGMPPSGTGGGGGGIFRSSGGGTSKGLPIGVVLLLIVAYFVFNMLSGGGPVDTTYQEPTQPIYEPLVTQPSIPTAVVPQATSAPITAATSTTRPLATSGAAGKAQTWTVLLYADADDSVLEQDIYMDLNEAERVGSTDQVKIVAQVDRYAGAYAGDGDWTSTRRYLLTKDNDLNRLNSKVLADLGELSMADPKVLIDFVTWGIKTYPADKYVLILSDHGMGWPGGWTDPRPQTLRSVNVPFSQVVETNMMYTNEIDDALTQIRQQTGLDKFELIGLDACLMSDLAVYSALAPHARYVVNSQETEPSLGWAYTAFLTTLTSNPGIDGGQLGSQIVSTFIDGDQRINDTQARLEFLRQGSPLGGLFGQTQDVDPRQLSQQISRSITLTAARMDALPGLMDSFNNFVFALQKEDQTLAARARTYAQSYTSIFGKDVPPSYIDLGNFVQIIQKETSSAALRSAADAVISSLKQVVVAEKHGSQKPGSTGISIYFPNSQLYQNAMAGPRSYNKVADRFVKASLWDDFLAYHYTRVSFANQAGTSAVPAENTRVTSPGSSAFEVSALKLSATETDYDKPVTLEADLKGSNIGYVYLFVGYYDATSKSILVADKDYLEAPKTRQIGDLYYPLWTESTSFKLKYVWTPSVFAINDGKQSVVALLQPERYGASAEEAVYTADGIYKSVSTGETRYARMYFSNGKMMRMFGFAGQTATGTVHEIIPEMGDQISLIETWLESDGSGGYRQVYENGKTLTFGSQTFTWKEMYAAAGNYVIGYVVSDLDGNEKSAFGTIRIR